MKNRFFVINKEKIYAYVVSIMTIVVIFFMTNMMHTDLKEIEEVSSNDVQNSAIGEAVTTTTSNMEGIDNENKNNINSKDNNSAKIEKEENVTNETENTNINETTGALVEN